MNKWRCGDCGFRLEADTPPEECPSCNKTCEWIDDNPYVPGLSRTGEIYVCSKCGTKAKYVKDGGGVLICCGEKMEGKFPGH